MNKDRYKKGQLRVWWIPQVPMRAFYVLVDTLAEAQLLVETLAMYDAFQYSNAIKPDYSNVGGVQEWQPDYDPNEDGEYWSDWYSEDGDDFKEFVEQHPRTFRNRAKEILDINPSIKF